jgi:23S rRNA (uridine2552-2'-O)-methyltransferase
MPKPYNPNDKWARKAKDEGFRARSIYKLQEIDEKFHLLKAGMIVLDLGAAPGSWLQYVSGKIGTKGIAIGIDLQKIETIGANVHTVEQDMLDIDAVEKIVHSFTNASAIDLLLSDAAPNTSGIRDVDQWRSIELNQSALAVGKRLLKSGGRCVLKVFQGADFDPFIKDVRKDWKDVQIIKAKTSRDRSMEVYVITTKR